jgi:hypothetical protein
LGTVTTAVSFIVITLALGSIALIQRRRLQRNLSGEAAALQAALAGTKR